FNNKAPNPTIFTIDNPARLVLDFKNLSINDAEANQKIDVGNVSTIKAVESQGRVRVVVELLTMSEYQTRIEGDNLILTLNSVDEQAVKGANKVAINEVDFRRGPQGEGLVILNFDGEVGNINTQDEGDKIVVNLANVKIPDELERRLNVIDFATPVQLIDTYRQNGGVKIVIAAQGEYDHLGYQVNNQFTLEVKPLTKEQKEEKLKSRFGYRGERLSLMFQDIEVRAVLQLIADFTSKNMVTSDTVGGSITLRLKNVPWDQALDIILKTKGLAMREEGNVIRVAPMEEIAKIEEQELKSRTQIAKLLPKFRELIQINYRLPSDIITILQELIVESNTKDKGKDSNANTDKEKSGDFISSDVKFVPDDKTSKIIVYGTRNEITKIRQLIEQLDLPVKQVVIDARIVSAKKSFSQNIGFNWNSSYDSATNVSKAGLTTLNLGSSSGQASFTGNLAVKSLLGADFLLDLELQASESDGDVEIISSPRVSTTNGETATISQGESIPTVTPASANSPATTEYIDATLNLTVKPVITPNNRVQMLVTITNNKPGTGGNIDKEEIKTNIVVNNGDTVVLGGIFKNTQTTDETKVPLLGDIPVLGYLFKGENNSNIKSELLIFITPRILNTDVSVKM
ncbi:MAG: type IV pilus secretin PilQ, partial [Gammaproteobacteria bacterium]|nr:type IV pilus secretin PilQ [Gammaproteobacteria bacterium]